MSFATLGLSAPIVDAVAEQGYKEPSPIQLKAIPAVITGKDIMAAAQTGTGKTAAFTLPLLERLSSGERVQPNQVRALVLTPTRELAAQVAESVSKYSQRLPLRSAVVFGGVKINPQMMKLRKGVDVLVATPGRLLDLYKQNAVKFNQLEILVLDEADRMLDMGFIHDIRRILALLPKNRQNLLFSATFSDEIRQLAKGILTNPVEISVSPRNKTATTVSQWISPVDKKKKPDLLLQLVKQGKWEQVLVFTKTKRGADKLARFMEISGINAAAIHGNKSQGSRTKALEEFKNGTVKMLVATDIAARGLDINQLPQVVNFDLPNVPEDYVHRIGRTGRAGANGQAVSLVSADEAKQLFDIERVINQLLTRKVIDGFEPIHDVPPSRLPNRPISPKKPKKPKPGHRDGQRSGEVAAGHKVHDHTPSAKKPYAGKRPPSRTNPAKPGSRKPAGNNPKKPR
ncbi:MAG: DEAD/DEAH box helicase [Hahellaceae bacterium]|nr:DEAD/DEAH box helicase [Hahellaceae bacterium]